MNFGPGTFLFGYLAGVLSTLSPCVLPLLPILVASALARHRFGPVALAGGLAVSFAAVGLFVATLGASLGLDTAWLRRGAAVLMTAFGIVLVVPALASRFATLAGGIGAVGGDALARVGGAGWSGQFLVGAMLGLVWSPCVGPTLGAASTLASQGRDLAQIALLMLFFGLGAGSPLLLVGLISREATARGRGRLLALGHWGRAGLGVVLVGVGLSIVTGADRPLEAWAVDHSPDWLTELTTRF